MLIFDYPGGPDLNINLLLKGRKMSEKRDDAMLLSLKKEEGAVNHTMSIDSKN
jgi:hypothetical protein